MRTALFAVFLLAGCAAVQNDRERWSELDAAKAEGFAGAVSFGKATALLTHAKLQQTVERFPSCIDASDRARFYIKESRAGR